MASGIPSFFKTYPRAAALVLAASKGSRLFPMTSPGMPKHLLPIAGIACILRLLENLSSFSQVVIAISAEDTETLPLIAEALSENMPKDDSESSSEIILASFTVMGKSQTINIIQLSPECFGPIDALRAVEETKIVHPSSRLVVLPGDLVFLQQNVNLERLLRPPSASDCVILLIDVGEVDEHGLPIKESAKAKKGGFSRDEEDIEYIGLSYPLVPSTLQCDISSSQTVLPKVLLKQSKIDVEADEDMTGSTAKLEVPKSRLRYGKFVVKTSWNDVHVYSLAPWIRQLILSRKGLVSFQEDLLPLLISRQVKGKKATFGKSTQAKCGDQEEKENFTRGYAPEEEESYSVSALVLSSSSTVIRANTIAAYLYACRETVVNGAALTMPADSKWNGKFQTLVLKDSTLGAKINMKSSVVGKNCELGAKCRLNNVIIMDDVTIGENCSLQNTIIGSGAKLGNNCSLNDCQVGPGKEIPTGTKEKGESFMVGDTMAEDLL